MPTGTCPECEGDVHVDIEADKGEIVDCEECGVQLEVVACATGPVSPPVVDLLHHRVLLGCGRVHRLGL